MEKWSIGIDIGGTKISIAQVNAAGKIVKKILLNTNVVDGAKAIEREIIHAVESLVKDTENAPVGIGIGVAGQVNPETGLVYFAPNLNWHNVPLKSDLESALKLPVIVTDDVRAITYGEWRYGAGQNCNDFICLFVGTGIGGGIVSRGQFLTGSSNTAGEFGHITIDYKGRCCTCGNQGCFEAIAGGWAIALRAQEAVKKDPKEGRRILELAKGDLGLISAKTVSEAFMEGDQLAKKIFAETEEALIAGTVSIVNGLNPQRIILGSGIIQGNPWLVKAIDKGVRDRALKAACLKLEIVSSSLFSDAGVIGAGSLVFLQNE
jgi:glucokinase